MEQDVRQNVCDTETITTIGQVSTLDFKCKDMSYRINRENAQNKATQRTHDYTCQHASGHDAYHVSAQTADSTKGKWLLGGLFRRKKTNEGHSCHFAPPKWFLWPRSFWSRPDIATQGRPRPRLRPLFDHGGSFLHTSRQRKLPAHCAKTDRQAVVSRLVETGSCTLVQLLLV